MKTLTTSALLSLALIVSATAAEGLAPPKGGNNPKTKATQAQAAKADAPLTLPGLTDFTVADLVVPSGIPETTEIAVTLGGQRETLRLVRTSQRSVSAKLLLDEGNGALREVPLPPFRTYRGTLVSNLDVRLSASVIDGKLWAMIDALEGTWFIQPLSDYTPDARATAHVVATIMCFPLLEHAAAMVRTCLFLIGSPKDSIQVLMAIHYWKAWAKAVSLEPLRLSQKSASTLTLSSFRRTRAARRTQ